MLRGTRRRGRVLRGWICPLARRSSALTSARAGRATYTKTSSKTIQYMQYIPKPAPLRPRPSYISKDGNNYMPQLRFNEDGEWHDFAPESVTGLKAGPWFPYLVLHSDSRLSDHRVNRP